MRRKVLRVIRFLHGAMVLTAVMSGVCLLLSIFGMTPESYFPYSLLVLVTYVATAFAEEKIKGIGLFLLISIASTSPPKSSLS